MTKDKMSKNSGCTKKSAAAEIMVAKAVKADKVSEKKKELDSKSEKKGGKRVENATPPPPPLTSSSSEEVSSEGENEEEIDIKKLVVLEKKLMAQRLGATSSVSLDAKVNILKCRQISAVLQYQAAYDALYYELDKEGGLQRLRNIAPVGSVEPLQPKFLEPQDCGKDDQLEKQLTFFLAEAKLAKRCLDELVTRAVQGWRECKVDRVDVKSPESTRRKANTFCSGDVRKVADMARVTVICDTPEALERAYVAVMRLFQPQDVLRVKNGFNSDWMPGGYRDVKVSPVVNEHLCEIQLQLKEFHELKSGQHAVYKWARDLNVTKETNPEDLFKNLSPEVLEEMIHLAQDGWKQAGYCLPDLLRFAGQYDLAETRFRKALSEAEEVERGCEDRGNQERRFAMLNAHTTRSLLGEVLVHRGKYDEARPLIERALAISETLGPEHPDVAIELNNLASVLEAQGEYTKAEPLYELCRAIQEKALGSDHPLLANTLNNLAVLLDKQGKAAEAASLYERCQAMQEKVLGRDHPDVATTLNNRAALLDRQEKYDEAEPLYRLSLAILQKALGLNHPNVAKTLVNLAGLLESQEKYAEAEPLYVSSLAILKEVFGPDHPDVATTLGKQAALFGSQEKYAEAEPLYESSISILQKALGPDHPDVATTLNDLAGLFDSQAKYAEAGPLYERAQSIQERALDPDHPDLVTTLDSRAWSLGRQGKTAEAEALYSRCQAIEEKTLGMDHPDVATTLNNRAILLEHQEKYAEAKPLYEQCQAIQEKALGHDHPDVATTLINLAGLPQFQEKYMEAVPLLKRALRIRTKEFGGSHPDTVNCQDKLDIVRQKVRPQLEPSCRHVKPTTRNAGTTENPSFRVAGVKTGSKQLPAKAAGHCKGNDQDKDNAPVVKSCES